MAGEAFMELNDLQQENPGLLDLNMAPEDDWGVDDLMQSNDNMDEDFVDNAHPEDIIAMNSPSDAASPPAFDLNEPAEVEVFIPMEDGVPLQINPDEFHEDELMGPEDVLMEQSNPDFPRHSVISMW